MGPHELLLIGIGIVATVVLGGGGTWLMGVIKGKQNIPPKA